MSEKHGFLAGTIVCIICDRHGCIEIHHFKPYELADACIVLTSAQVDDANWGKIYEVRERDGKYVFHREFQQRI